MGVSGCGKSSVGDALARALALPLIEGDDFHPADNVARMRSGQALTDADRAGWLDALSQELARHAGGAVLTCSALKLAYRDRLRVAVPELRFVFMRIAEDEAQRRVAARAQQHIFPASLVASQFATLESPEAEPGVLSADATAPVEHTVAAVQRWLA